MRLKRCATAVVVLMAVIYSVHSATEKTKRDKELVVGFAPNPFVTQTSVGGRGMADTREMFQAFGDEFARVTGCTLSLKFYPAPKFLYNAIQEKNVDVGIGFLEVYLTAIRLGIPVKLLAAWYRDEYCVWVHKDRKLKSLTQLKGKSFVTLFPIESLDTGKDGVEAAQRDLSD